MCVCVCACVCVCVQRCPASAGAACPRKVDAHMGNFVSFGCTRNNTYNDLATLFFNTQVRTHTHTTHTHHTRTTHTHRHTHTLCRQSPCWPPAGTSAHRPGLTKYVCTYVCTCVCVCPQDDAIRALFSSSTKREYTVPALILFVTAFYWLAVLTYGMSCPTGFFVPAILCGAAYGRLVRARSWLSLSPTHTHIHPTST